jgi:hypothetical protein
MSFVPVSISLSKQQIMFLVFPPSIVIEYFLVILKIKWTHVGHVIFDPPQFRFVFFIQIYKNSNSHLKFNWSFYKISINRENNDGYKNISKYIKSLDKLQMSFVPVLNCLYTLFSLYNYIGSPKYFRLCSTGNNLFLWFDSIFCILIQSIIY